MVVMVVSGGMVVMVVSGGMVVMVVMVVVVSSGFVVGARKPGR